MDVNIPLVGHLPLALNQVHNLLTCTDCHIRLSFDSVLAHMKDNHGLRCDEDRILAQLNIVDRTMNSISIIPSFDP